MNKDDFEKIEYFERKDKENKLDKYGFDIYEKYEALKRENTSEKIKKRRNIKIIISIVVIFIITVSCWANFVQFKHKRARMIALKSVYQLDFKEEKVNTDITGNGFLIYKIEEIPELEIHAISTKDDIFIEDFESRMYKYFFDRWNDSDKSKFVVEESYEDYTYGLHTKKNWLLKYKTYIEVSNYEEMLDATEIIIKFRDYMPYPQIIVESYIKYDNNYILPHNVSIQENDQVRESAIKLFLMIEKGKK